MRRACNIFGLLLLSILFFQCQRDLSYYGASDNPASLSTPDPISAIIQGNVLDEMRQPSGAVAEQQIEDKNIFNGAGWSYSNPTTIKGYTDSFLYRATAGILLQTDYHWKRISLGLRYTRALQPFIKYTRPDGTVLDEKNQALQAVLRFRVF